MVPHHLHEELAVAALDAGTHVLLEKPMAPTLEACDRILAAARRAATVFWVAENAQYWPEVVLARDLIDEGAVGDVITARAWHCSAPMAEFHGAGNWRFSVADAGGGVAIDAGSHWLRPLRMWLGELVEVVAVTGRPFEAMEGESLVRSLCRFDSGVVASFDAVLSPGPTAPLPLFQITGSRGEIVIDVLGRVKVYDGTDFGGTVVGQGGYMQSYERQMAQFEAAVLDDRRLHRRGPVRVGRAPRGPGHVPIGPVRSVGVRCGSGHVRLLGRPGPRDRRVERHRLGRGHRLQRRRGTGDHHRYPSVGRGLRPAI